MLEDEEVELPVPVTLLEMSDCVGAVSKTVALVAKLTTRVPICLPCKENLSKFSQCFNAQNVWQIAKAPR